MKAYWEYRCDEGHSWTILRGMDETENPDDARCPYGHEAVTLHKAPLLDMVQIAIRPAARVVDEVTGRVGREHEYYLVVVDLHSELERMSKRSFSWNDAKAAMDRFRLRPDKPGTVSAERAWQILDELDSPDRSLLRA